ncbi:transcriptional repressor CTCFL-like isoform X2 [Myzus persicae]|uniref:transcriptional repressor CTCFL-like isoform X2 n=1 Tax=Myzus persicae TaxID=13164 RepID=UPI000B9313A1|nr:transcriptional repressor CTCFL-like isoform X2 [Myzus persicae]
MSENGGTTIELDGGSSDDSVSFDENLIKLEHQLSISDTEETITDLQNYLDSFNTEIEGNEVTQVQAEPAHLIDQNAQCYYHTTARDGHVVMVEGHPDHELQMLDNTNQSHTDNLTQIALPYAQDEINKDIPQIVALGSGNGYQTVTLIQSETDANNYVLYVVKQNDKNEEMSNVSLEISQGDYDPNVKNAYNLNDGKDPTLPKKQKIEDSKVEDEKTKIHKLVPKKSGTVTPQVHVCDYCNYSSKKRYLLTRHMKSHSKERPYQCDICARGFKTQASLQNHVNTHTGTKPFNCRSCSSSFTTSGELVRHNRYKHTHEKPHKCTLCDYASVEVSKMKNHMRCHTGERPYQCPHCSYGSPDKFKLKRHLRIHTGEKPYECDICLTKFTQSNSLKTHRLIHSGAKPVFKCDHCPVTCGRKTDLRIHVQKLHTSDKPILCNRCGKAFPDRYQFKVHCLSHKGEKCFKCKLCSYASTTERHLQTHMFVHSDKKPFQCDQCDQAFRQKQLLRRHHNLHHNPAYVPPQPHEKTYHCNSCRKSFRHKGNLVRHMEIHMRQSTGNYRNTALKQRLEYTDSTNEGESEEDASILTRGTEIVSVKGEDGQQYVLLEKIYLGGQKQKNCTSTNVSLKHVDQSSSPSPKDLTVLQPVSVADVKEEFDEDLNNFFSFADEADEEITNTVG